MDKKELLKAISSGEDSTKQFKADIHNPDSIAAEMVAFSNSEGGRIFIGVSDNGSINGLSLKDISRINQLISNTASQHIRSPISPITENVLVGKQGAVIVLTVPVGIDKPYFDRNGIIWLKSGAEKKERYNQKMSCEGSFRKVVQYMLMRC